MERKYCSVARDGHVLTVTIERADQRNALNPPANHELGAVFDDFETDPDLWIAILTGSGEQAFCAGADLKSDIAGSTDFVPPSGFGGLTSRFDRRKPVIAAVNGFAMGGGFELALACDIIVAAERARFGLTEPRVGLAALGGGIQRVLREIGPKRAHGMLLTGKQISAAQALDWGVVNEVMPNDELMAGAKRWADDILACSPTSVIATKAVAARLDGQTVQQSMETMFALPQVKAIFAGPDSHEGPRAFAERRKPAWANPA